MAYDPTKPQENTPLDAAQMRSQFAGLKALLDDRAHRVDDVNGLGMTVQDPFDASQLQAVADKLDELLDALKRA